VDRAASPLLVVLLLLLLTSCTRAPEPLPTYGEIPNFTLTAHTGAPFSLGDLEGKVWVADFIFTNCTGPCPRMSSLMRKVQNSLGDLPDVRFVSFTVDPERDTPEVLAAYGKRFQAREGIWFFLAGPKPTLDMLSREAFKLGNLGADHSTRFVLVDRHARIRGYYGTSDETGWKRLLADVRRISEEPS